jgi:transposase
MKIVIGVDPHKLSVTIEVIDDREQVLAIGRFATDNAGYAAMRRHVVAWPERTWAVEGSNGAGRPVAQRLLADGEHVEDVPAKLAARVRMLDTGHGRKTDAHDAHSVAVAAVRAKELRVLALDPELEALRMLVDRRAELARRRAQTANRLQRLLAELTPGKAKKDITTLQAKAILASVRPRDLVGKTRRRLAAEQLADLAGVEKKIKALTKELKALVHDSGSTLMDLPALLLPFNPRSRTDSRPWAGMVESGREVAALRSPPVARNHEPMAPVVATSISRITSSLRLQRGSPW